MNFGQGIIILTLVSINISLLGICDAIKKSTKDAGHVIDYSIRSARYDYIVQKVVYDCTTSTGPTISCTAKMLACINNENSKIDDFDYMRSYFKCKGLI